MLEMMLGSRAGRTTCLRVEGLLLRPQGHRTHIGVTEDFLYEVVTQNLRMFWRIPLGLRGLQQTMISVVLRQPEVEHSSLS